MKVKIKYLNELAKQPLKNHKQDFCYDVYATSVEEVAPNIYKYGTGIALQMERSVPFQACEGEVEPLILSFMAFPRSSVWKTGLILSNSAGIIDEGYTGEISLVFHHVNKELPIYEVGDRIGQIYVGITVPMDFVEVDELDDTDRGNNGYGSTGNK